MSRIDFKLNYLLFFTLLVSYNSISVAQVYRTQQFVEYQDVKNLIDQGDNSTTLRRKYNLLDILLLDSALKQTLFENSSDLKEEFYKYSPALKLSKSTVGFVTEKESIRDVLNSKEGQERIFNAVYSNRFVRTVKSEISFPIYIKENEAIFETLSSFTSDLFYIRLSDGVVQINWLGGTIE